VEVFDVWGFADVRSDVLGKWRSGGRQVRVRGMGRVDGPRRYGEEEVKKQPRRHKRDWRRGMSRCDRRQRAATKVVLGWLLPGQRPNG
jgi:hypothetical protein